MKIYMLTDLEGVAGVMNFNDYGRPEFSRYYEVARELTTGEVNAAVEGLLEAGATEIIVADSHGPGAINPLLLHPEAKLLRGAGEERILDKSFDACVVVGQHAKSNTDGGHLCHTGSFTVENLSINGISIGELGQFMLCATYHKVPTVMVSGDKAACEEAFALVPNIEVAPVKEGIKKGSATGLTREQNLLFNSGAIHLHPSKARRLIREKAQRGLERKDEIKIFWLEPPYELVIRMRPEVEGERGKVASVKSNNLLELFKMPRKYEYISS